MKKAEGIGALIGSVLGAAGTGVVLYMGGNIMCILITVFGFLAGSYIGRSIDQKK